MSFENFRKNWSWLALAFAFALTLPFQNCGQLENSPGNGQGYEGVKAPDGAGSPQSQIGGTPSPSPAPAPPPASPPATVPPPPPAVTNVKLASSYSGLDHSPMALWTKTTYAHFQQYQVSIFSYPRLEQLNLWSDTSEPVAQYTSGLTLGHGMQYVIGVRILGTHAPGPVTYSLPWTAYDPAGNNAGATGTDGF